MRSLRALVAIVVIRERQRDLRHIHGRCDTLTHLVRAVPSPISTDDQTLQGTLLVVETWSGALSWCTTPLPSGGSDADVDMVVVVAALVGLPDALDAFVAVREREEPTCTRLCLGALSRVAGQEAASFHELVTDRTVVGSTVRGHPEVGGVTGEMV